MLDIKSLFSKIAALFLAILMVFIFTSSVQARISKETQKNDGKRILLKEQMGLLGPVKSVKLFIRNSDTDYVTFGFREDGSLALIDNTPKVSPSQSVRTFDSKERPLKEQIIDADGTKFDTYSNYDENKQTFMTKSVSGVVLRTGKMDKKGHIIEAESYNINGQYIGKSSYEYNKDGLMIRTKQYTFTNILMSKKEFSYDSNSYNIERTFYKPTTMPPTDLQLDTKYTRQYDSCGRVIESETYFEGTHAVRKTFYTYQEFDKYGNWTKSLEKSLLSPGEERIDSKIRQIEYFE